MGRGERRASFELLPEHHGGSLVPPLFVGHTNLPSFAFEGTINGLCLIDHSTIPPMEGPAYPVLVSTVDTDGNASDGLRHSVLQAPRATLLGWNLRAEGFAQGDIYSFIGGKIPFDGTKAERLTKGSLRLSVEEHCSSNDDYVAKPRQVCDSMIADRLLLPRDADCLIAGAEVGEDVLTVA